MERNDLHTTALGLLVAAGLALGLHGGPFAPSAAADDTMGSWHAITTDEAESFAARGDLIINKTPPDALGINPGAAPTTVYAIDAGHWSFDLWYTVVDWELFIGPPADGANDARLGIRGVHKTAPHPDEGDTMNNTLPAVTGNTAEIIFGTGATLAVAGGTAHDNHWDSYKARSDTFAYDAGGGGGGRRRVGTDRPGDPFGNFKLEADHVHKEGMAPTSGDATAGSSPAQGTLVTFDPDAGTLTLRIGGIDILDREGGASGTVAPEYREDPLVGRRMGEVVMRYAGFDPDPGVHVFEGGEFFIPGPEGTSTTITGGVAELCVTSTAPAPAGAALGNFSLFGRLAVSDTLDPDAWRSTWADRFVDQGWFGEGLTPLERAQRVLPTLTLSTPDGDLVRETDGFRRRAEMPATVLLTIAIDPDATLPCYADLDGDGVLTIFDFLEFQNLFVAGDARADCDGDGDLSIFDFLCFQNAFVAGCGG